MLQFLSELTKLFNANQSRPSSLYITMKRYDGRTKPHPKPKNKSDPKYKPRRPRQKSESNPVKDENKCLIRAQIGNKKISTVIAARDINKFQQVSGPGG